MEAREAVDLIAGIRVFLATRERIKQPEGLELFDECINVLRGQIPLPRKVWPECGHEEPCTLCDNGW
ncbi:MAG TPA: hypothetical protein VN731_10375 [Rhodanobacter sp.]|nr:hypothetical protein [Rhodanobacter sp.]